MTKWRPIYRIYPLETAEKQQPSLLCAQRYSQRIAQYMAHSRYSINKGYNGHAFHFRFFCSTSINYTKTTFGESKIWDHLLWTRLHWKVWSWRPCCHIFQSGMNVSCLKKEAGGICFIVLLHWSSGYDLSKAFLLECIIITFYFDR